MLGAFPKSYFEEQVREKEGEVEEGEGFLPNI